MAVKFLKCSICGNIVGLIQDGGGELVCCGKPMQELVANTEDAAQEKHVPVFTVDRRRLFSPLPMVQLRSPLMLIAICTDCGRQSCNICRLTFIKHFFSQCRSPDR